MACFPRSALCRQQILLCLGLFECGLATFLSMGHGFVSPNPAAQFVRFRWTCGCPLIMLFVCVGLIAFSVKNYVVFIKE